MKTRLRDFFVDDLGNFWKWASTWGLAVLLFVEVTLRDFPPELLPFLPPEIAASIPTIIIAATFLGRILRQTPKKEDNNG
jgi:membrane protein YqaA with SNARE-associated domain